MMRALRPRDPQFRQRASHQSLELGYLLRQDIRDPFYLGGPGADQRKEES